MVIILYVLLIVNVDRNKLNVNGSKCKCTCNIVIFKELMIPSDTKIKKKPYKYTVY